MARFLTLRDYDFRERRVLLRVDFNVPLENGIVADDFRIRVSLPTVRHLLKQRAKLIIATSLGRPPGRVVHSLRLDNVAKRFSELIKRKVRKLDEAVGEGVKKAVSSMKPGDIVMLENLRFYPGEENDDSSFALKLASLADFYVNDAFANSHRLHASMVGVTRFLPSFAGFLLEKEVTTIKRVMKNPKHPFIVVVGGAKLQTKLPMLMNLARSVDHILIGGAMAFPFLEAKGFSTGKSANEKALIPVASMLLKRYGKKIVLPSDFVVARRLGPDEKTKAVPVNSIPDDMLAPDIGKDTVGVFSRIIGNAKTIIWNGPMGVFEVKPFNRGTVEVAHAIARSKAVSVAGGGDTSRAVREMRIAKSFELVSTGGGASLMMFEGKTLPAVYALEENYLRFSRRGLNLKDYLSPLHDTSFKKGYAKRLRR